MFNTGKYRGRQFGGDGIGEMYNTKPYMIPDFWFQNLTYAEYFNSFGKNVRHSDANFPRIECIIVS